MIHHIATTLLRVIEQPVPMINLTGEFLKQWPHSAFQAIATTKLLRKGGVDTQWRCQRCANTCIADVEWHTADDGSTQPYVHCEYTMEWGAIPLDRKDLELWHTSFTHLAEATAGLLDFQAPRKEVIPDRLWWLGGKVIAQRDVDIFLARGADWEDASALFLRNGRMRECATPLVLVPCDVPVPSPFPASVSVRSLASLLRFDGRHLQLRHEQLVETVRLIGAKRQQLIIPIPTSPGTTWSQVLIEFANDDYVQVSIGKERHSRSFADMGFADLRKPEPTPNELWGHFRTLAKFDGRIGWDTPGVVTEKDRMKVGKWMSGISQRLQVVFPDIVGDPFEQYKKVKAYQVKCMLRIK